MVFRLRIFAVIAAIGLMLFLCAGIIRPMQ
jgi:hypothetical protein